MEREGTLRRSNRQIKSAQNQAELDLQVANFIIAGWNQFIAETVSDRAGTKNYNKIYPKNNKEKKSSQNTLVELWVEGGEYSGKGGTGISHGELDAVESFLKTWDNDSQPCYNSLIGATILCQEKPICVKCASILGHLGIKILDFSTRKATYVMQMTSSYGIPDKIKDLLLLYYLNNEEITRFQHYWDQDTLEKYIKFENGEASIR